MEELYLLQKLTRGLGSGNIDFRPRRRDFSSDGKRAGAPWLGLKLSEIKDLDAVLVIGSFLRKDHPLFAQRLRQLAKKQGRVSLVSVSADDPLIKLHERITVAPSNLPLVVAAIINAVAQLKGVAAPAGLQSIEACAGSKAIAETLLSGEKRAIFLGNVAEQSAQAALLHALAAELSALCGASLGFIGEAANSVGGYIAGSLPTGLNAYEMFAQPRKAYVLMGVEPELDCQNPQLAVAALKQAALTIMLTPFKHQAALDYADVLLPVAPFSETSGTYINTEGRVQTFSGVCRPLGETRPGWKVLRVLANGLALNGFDYESSEQIRQELVPDTTVFVDGLDNAISGIALSLPQTNEGLQRIADVPIHFADPLVRRSPALQATRDAVEPSVRMNAVTLAQYGLSDGIEVRVQQGQGEALLKVMVDEGVPTNCVRVSAAHTLTAALGDMFGTINVERA